MPPRYKQLLFMDPNNAQEAKNQLYNTVKAELPLALPDDVDIQNNVLVPEPGDFFQAMKKIKLQKEQEVGRLFVFSVLNCCPLIVVLDPLQSLYFLCPSCFTCPGFTFLAVVEP